MSSSTSNVGTLDIKPLSATVGAEITDVDLERIREDEALPGLILEALDKYGVLLFRELHIDDATQAVLGHKLGDVRLYPELPTPEIFEVSYNPDNPYGDQLRGNINWHTDGILDQAYPGKAAMLSAKVVSSEGGETQFASSYAAYDLLTDEEKEKYADARVVFTYEASQRRVFDDPTPEQVASWRERPDVVHPLVWTHESGRKSLVLGSTHDHIVGMDREEGRRVLDDMLARATQPERIYEHSWTVGDLVIWDNGGLYHRGRPGDPQTPRRMHRTTLLGEEPIR